MVPRPTFLEFFAGGGMAHAGLHGLMDCAFANDIDPMKCAAYRANFGEHIVQDDIWNLRPADIPAAQLAWASFPCQDLSLAGGRRGLNAPRSGAFWGFWNIMEKKGEDAPKTIVIENVAGLLTSDGGRDFTTLVTEFADAGYCVGAMLIDAALFSPQSRPRIFIVAHKGRPPSHLIADGPDPLFHPNAILGPVHKLPPRAKKAWVWWRLPKPPARNSTLASVLERNPPDKCWRDQASTRKLIGQMTTRHRQRVEEALAQDDWQAGAVFRRMRVERSKRVQRAEVRYDGLAGCLRTPAGGSSKQLLLITENGKLRLRPLLGREAARLMGVSDDYILPPSESAALKIFGDGVCVGAVRWLGQKLLLPLVTSEVGAVKSKVTSLSARRKVHQRDEKRSAAEVGIRSRVPKRSMRRTR